MASPGNRHCASCIGTLSVCFVVWRPRRSADTSTNRRQGFLCLPTASKEQAADRVSKSEQFLNGTSAQYRLFSAIKLVVIKSGES